MTKRLVLRATDKEGNHNLLALELLPGENQVSLKTLSGELATDENFLSLKKIWAKGQVVELPEGILESSFPLTITGSLLPEGFVVEDDKELQGVQNEWHFVVLSHKFYQKFYAEWKELEEKVNALEDFSKDVWNDLKAFWSRVQEQVRDKNLQPTHSGELRNLSDSLFNKMKGLRSQKDKDLQLRSTEVTGHFHEELEKLEQRITEGNKLRQVFEDLKSLQREFHNATFTRKHRNKIWKRMDAAFKAVKEKRFGSESGESNSALQRLESRFKGLLGAIGKMERSIQRDQSDLDYENQKIERSEGQLEAQIRQAKIKMIEERKSSKAAKLEDMLRTREELEKRKESLEKKAAKEAERREARAKKEQEKKQAKQAKVARHAGKSIRRGAARTISDFAGILATPPDEVPSAYANLSAFAAVLSHMKKG